MATRVLTTLQDDIDGSAAVETVRFALDGVEWGDRSVRAECQPAPQQPQRLHCTWPQNRRQAAYPRISKPG